MAFKSRQALGGAIDENINTKGRIKSDKELTGRALRQRELLSLVRKIKPHVSLAITEAVKILGNKEAADSNKLKAAVIILDQYKGLVKDIYDVEDDSPADEIQQNGPVFSLTMIRGDKDVTDVESK
jgi:hypothetical protein